MEKKINKKTTKTKETKTSKKSPSKKVVKTNTTKKKITKKKAKKGFTLIELLAVIIILGVLMIVAIPAVTSYISSSRKSSYITTVKNLISGARNIVNSGKLGTYDTSVTYYLPFEMIPTETGTRTPYGDMKQGYVVVTYNGRGYEYYWTGTDTSEEGIYLTYQNKLDNERILTGVKAISTDIAICGKENIVVFDKNGSVVETKDAEDCIIQGDVYDGGSSSPTYVAVDTDFIEFNNGSITGIHDIVDVRVTDYENCADYFYTTVGWYASRSEALSYCQNDLENELNSNASPYVFSYAEELRDANVIKVNRLERYPKNLIIPEKINNVTVTSIGASAFHLKELESVTIPKTVTRIEDGAFFGNNLKSVKIPTNVTSIGSNAFSENPFLYEIINKTGKTFNWGSMFGQYTNDSFVTGTYNYSVSEETFFRNNYRYYYPYMLKKEITSNDTLTINIDDMFDYGPYHFNLKNNVAGYKVYTFNSTSRQYELASVGPMNYISGYCGARLANFYITDNSGNIVFSSLYKFSEENAVC